MPKNYWWKLFEVILTHTHREQAHEGHGPKVFPRVGVGHLDVGVDLGQVGVGLDHDQHHVHGSCLGSFVTH